MRSTNLIISVAAFVALQSTMAACSDGGSPDPTPCSDGPGLRIEAKFIHGGAFAVRDGFHVFQITYANGLSQDLREGLPFEEVDHFVVTANFAQGATDGEAVVEFDDQSLEPYTHGRSVVDVDLTTCVQTTVEVDYDIGVDAGPVDATAPGAQTAD